MCFYSLLSPKHSTEGTSRVWPPLHNLYLSLPLVKYLENTASFKNQMGNKYVLHPYLAALHAFFNSGEKQNVLVLCLHFVLNLLPPPLLLNVWRTTGRILQGLGGQKLQAGLQETSRFCSATPDCCEAPDDLIIPSTPSHAGYNCCIRTSDNSAGYGFFYIHRDNPEMLPKAQNQVKYQKELNNKICKPKAQDALTSQHKAKSLFWE